MTLHPLAYHPLARDSEDLRRGFWFMQLDDRVRAYAIVRVGPQPPALLARVGAKLIPWRPSHG